MSRYPIVLSVCIGFPVLTSACGSTSRPKVESAAESQTEPLKVSQTADERTGPISMDQSSTETPQAETEHATASTDTDVDEATSTLRHKATLIDLMTAGGTAYIIDYPHSGAMAAADASCSEKAAKAAETAKAAEAAKAARITREAKPTKVPSADVNAPTDEKSKTDEDTEAEETARAERVEAARAECLKQAREKFEADVIRFRRDGSGHIQLVISRRTGSAVKELSVTKVELKQTSGDSVRVELKEAGLGQRPILKDHSTFDVKVPNGYSIELEDAHFGKLPYIAKVGFVAN